MLGRDDRAMACANAVCVPLATRSLSEMSNSNSLGRRRILTLVSTRNRQNIACSIAKRVGAKRRV